MLRYKRRGTFGFTLTELAIVLAVVGVLAAGLWNLMSGANTQLRDQAAATQQAQLISAVKTFLSSTDGQKFMTTNAGGCGGACAPNATFQLPLPTSCAPAATFGGAFAGDPNLTDVSSGFCTTLPSGFTTATSNSYGQFFWIRILRDSTAANNPPATFSFMVMTSGGSNITDTSGARISSLIGGDGGFIYNTAICGTPLATPANACGAYGAWTATPGANYGFGGGGTPASAVGTVASRTYVSPQQNALSDWLARKVIPGDTNYSLNTMQTPEYLANYGIVMGKFTVGSTPPNGGTVAAGTTNNIYMSDYNSPVPTALTTTGGGTVFLQGGSILGNEPTIPGNNIVEVESSRLLDDPSDNSLVHLGTGCTVDSAASLVTLSKVVLNANCKPAMDTIGDVNIFGYLSAYSIYSAVMYYDQGGVKSDMRLKKDIVPVHDGLDQIDKLKPVSYRLKSTNAPSMGFLAQDVEKVYPDLVLEVGDGYKAVNYNGLLAPLVDAVQELRRENTGLRKQLDEQARSQKKLEDELQDLKSAQ